MIDRLGQRLRRTRLFFGLRLAYHLLRGGDRRQVAWLTLRRPPGLFQPSGTTQANRYPDVFAAVHTHLAGRERLRLLSFGCSTGEEVFTLADLFPDATIRGLDIVPGRIRSCQRRWRRAGRPARLTFACAADSRDEPDGVYDAVFAMAVFRHGALGAAPPICTPFFDPAAAAAALTDLARLLKPGGLLALRHANIRFSDLPIAAQFTPLHRCPPRPAAGPQTPIYGLDGKLQPGVRGDDGVYIKT